MPVLVPEGFPEKPKAQERYRELFDGQCWKVAPSEYEYELDEMKAFIASMKSAAHAQKVYIRTWETLDGHVLVQRRPLDYKPAQKGGSQKKKIKAA